MMVQWQTCSSQERMDPWSDHNGFEGSKRCVGWVDEWQGAHWKLEWGCCSFAPKSWRIKCWKVVPCWEHGPGAGAALGWCLLGVQQRGVRPWFAQGTSLPCPQWCGLCFALLHAQQVTLHLALLYKFMFTAVGETKRKGFLPARLTLQMVLLPLLLFWWVMWWYMFG